MITMYEVVVVGAGFAGSVLARKIAEETNKRVLVVEKRNHIGGNAYDEYDKNGILIQKYGPHFFATYQWWIIEYLKRFSDFYECPIKAVSFLEGQYIDRPYNFRTLQQLLGPGNSQKLLEKLRMTFPDKHRVTLYELLDAKESNITEYAQLLKQKVYIPYIAKQWGLDISEIDPEVVNRSEIVLGYDTQLCDWDFQYMPVNGYSSLFNNILKHPQIEVILGEDAIKNIFLDEEKHLVKYKGNYIKALVFTGSIDELFGKEKGDLPYRSRHFTYEYFTGGFQLPCGVVTYPKEREYIRQTEFKQFNPSNRKSNITVVQSEYSLPFIRENSKGNEPYYPILNPQNVALYNEYRKNSKAFKNLYLCGRLADYKYYDMDKVIIRAFDIFEKKKKEGAFSDKL